jgi:hypothetical protein
VAHACNSSYLGGWDQEAHGLRPAWANRSQDPICKITTVKWTGPVVQAIECLLCKHKALSSNPSLIKNEKRVAYSYYLHLFVFHLFLDLLQLVSPTPPSPPHASNSPVAKVVDNFQSLSGLNSSIWLKMFSSLSLSDSILLILIFPE